MLFSLVAVIPMQLFSSLTAALTRRPKFWSFVLLPHLLVIALPLGRARQTLWAMPSPITTKQFNAFGLTANLAGFSGTLPSWIQF